MASERRNCERQLVKRLYEGQPHVVDADVPQYFDTILYAELLQGVARRVADEKILHLLKLWLKSPVEPAPAVPFFATRKMMRGKGKVLRAREWVSRFLPVEHLIK